MKERLSALIDGELDELEERRVLNAIGEDVELRRTWERYHLIRSAMTRQLGVVVSADLPERIVARLETGTETPEEASGALRFWPLAGGFAAAAAIAGIAIFGMQALHSPLGNVPDTRVATAASASPAATASPATEVAVSSVPSDSTDQLSPYVVGHNEFMPTGGMASLFPYVRVVAHGNAEQ
ncbi:MAG TPA: sigma-E factor negative regulatory protein [Burkholderiales bacterium]